MYYTFIKIIESNNVTNQKFVDPKSFILWHDRFGYPGALMMPHPLKNQKTFLSNDYPCIACSQGKLVIKPSTTKVNIESPTFLERIHGYICGPIHPPCGPFRYFMVLIDSSARWSHVCLFSEHQQTIYKR